MGLMVRRDIASGKSETARKTQRDPERQDSYERKRPSMIDGWRAGIFFIDHNRHHRAYHSYIDDV
ncbi:hypothetical protein B0H17DRAFT_1092394, partial [Mycena rosella]